MGARPRILLARARFNPRVVAQDNPRQTGGKPQLLDLWKGREYWFRTPRIDRTRSPARDPLTRIDWGFGCATSLMTCACIRVEPEVGVAALQALRDSRAGKCLGGVLLIGLCACATSTLGQEAELEQVFVTGSRIARPDFDSASPIVSVTQELFERTGSSTVETALNTLPQFVPAYHQHVQQSGQWRTGQRPAAGSRHHVDPGADRWQAVDPGEWHGRRRPEHHPGLLDRKRRDHHRRRLRGIRLRRGGGRRELPAQEGIRWRRARRAMGADGSERRNGLWRRRHGGPRLRGWPRVGTRLRRICGTRVRPGGRNAISRAMPCATQGRTPAVSVRGAPFCRAASIPSRKGRPSMS